MKTFVLIFLTWGPILVQSSPIAENIDKKSELELIKENLTHSPILKFNDTKVKESELEVTKLDDSKLERSEDFNNDNLELKDESKLKDEVKVKKEFKLNDKLLLKDDLECEVAAASKCLDRAKKECRSAGPHTTPTKICFEVTPGVQGAVEFCKENGPEFSKHPQVYQESQPGPQIQQEPQQVTQPTQTNYEIPQNNNQVPQQNYGVPQVPVSNNGPQQPSVEIPTTWCIQTDSGMQKFDSVMQIEQQSPQGSEYQTQPQQFANSQNIPSSYPQNPSPQGSGYQTQPQQFANSQNIPSSYPQNPSPQGSGYQTQPQKYTFSQNIPFSYPQNPFYYPQNPSPQGSKYQIQPQRFTFSQNSPSSYSQNSSPQRSEYQIQPQQFILSQNIPSSYPQNPSPQRSECQSQPQQFTFSPNIPSSYPQNPSPQRSEYQIQPQQFTFSQDIPSSYPQNPSPQRSECQSQPQQFTFSPNIPSSYPQNPSPQRSEYQIQPQQFTWSENVPPIYPQNPSGYPQNQSGHPKYRFSNPQYSSNYPENTFPVYPNLPSGYPQTSPTSYPPLISPSYAPQNLPTYPQNFQYAPPQNFQYSPPQNFPCYCYQDPQPVFPQNFSPSFPIPPPQRQQESLSQVQPQQQFVYSQNGPSSFPQNIFSGNSQNPAIYSQTQPNTFYPFSDRPGNNPQFEKNQPDSQGYIPFGGNQFSNQGGVQSLAQEPSGGHFVQPTGAFPTAEGNSQSIQQQTPQNAIYLDARRVQPGPLSRILDRPSSFQMSGRPGNMESSFEFQQRSQPQSSGRGEQAPFRIQL